MSHAPAITALTRRESASRARGMHGPHLIRCGRAVGRSKVAVQVDADLAAGHQLSEALHRRRMRLQHVLHAAVRRTLRERHQLKLAGHSKTQTPHPEGTLFWASDVLSLPLKRAAEAMTCDSIVGGDISGVSSAIAWGIRWDALPCKKSTHQASHAGRMPPRGVAAEAEGLRLVHGRPLLDAVPEGLEQHCCVVCKQRHHLAAAPAAKALLQGLHWCSAVSPCAVRQCRGMHATSTAMQMDSGKAP